MLLRLVGLVTLVHLLAQCWLRIALELAENRLDFLDFVSRRLYQRRIVPRLAMLDSCLLLLQLALDFDKWQLVFLDHAVPLKCCWLLFDLPLQVNIKLLAEPARINQDARAGCLLLLGGRREAQTWALLVLGLQSVVPRHHGLVRPKIIKRLQLHLWYRLRSAVAGIYRS